MTKLYYTSGSCAAASFIAAFIANVPIETEQVNLREHKTSSGVDFYSINPKGNVPTLVLDDGTILNEGAAILQYIADQAPGTVAPLNGTIERYRVQAALNFVASEIHTSIGLRFRGFPPGSATYEYAEQLIAKKLTYLNEIELKDKKFLVGDKFSIADSYLYIVLSWLPPEDREKYPAIQAYFEGIKSLEGVIAAHARIATNPATAV